jgi:bifunctional NMN adenylyltransferase/nudix hydrolase
MRIGVVVGRFQTYALHPGHVALLETARQNSDHLIIFLGVSALAGTKRNPLDYATRHMMVNTHMRTNCPMFPFSIEPIKDVEDDSDWSKVLDSRIAQHTKFGDTVTLFGGDDSFLNRYTGRFTNHHRLGEEINHKATVMRAKVIEEPPFDSSQFRRGILYAIGNTRDTVSCTVDVACISDDKVLVGRKAEEKKWRFPGGFVDATDPNMFVAARREFYEETGLSLEGNLHFVGSTLVDDWRFRNSPDKAVMTTLFAGAYSFGKEHAGDDLEEVRWLPLNKGIDQMNHGHRKLFEMLNFWLINYKNVL